MGLHQGLAYVGIIALIGLSSSLDQPGFVYHDHDALTTFLQDVVQEYPEIAHLQSIGKSVEDRDLWVITISPSPSEHLELKPDLNLIGNIHGNEVVGREILIHFIYYLVTNYASNTRVKTLLDSARLQILVSMNPDGFARSPEGSCRPASVRGRTNGNGFDLNRNFPDYFVDNNVERQPETLAVMQWAEDNYFLMHSNLHGGALVVNYPYDNYIGGISPSRPSASNHISLSRDDDILRYVSLEYSNNHPRLPTIKVCTYEPPLSNSTNDFEDGITNGAAWYPTSGCMQDYFYIMKGAIAVTLEISCCKHPQASELERYYNENRDSLMAFYESSYKGVRGLVKDESGNALSGVLVNIVGRDHPRETTQLGEYWRMLLPGIYSVQFSKSCYKSLEKEITVPVSGHARLDITMESLMSTSGAAMFSCTGSITVILAFYHWCLK